MSYCFINGKIEEMSRAHIALNDLGVIRGYGVFDYLRTYNRKPFLLSENLKRFHNSADLLGLAIPCSDEQITEAIGQLIEKNTTKEASVRLVLTGGVSEDALTPGTPTFYILVTDLIELPADLYQNGVKLITHEYLRLVPEAKTLNYITAVRLLPQRKAAGAFEILYTYQGKILECTTSNFYIFKDGKLITAKEDILGGITRKVVLDIARKSVDVEEREIATSELASADEAFITAANKKVLPVVNIDNQQIGSGKVGENTKKLMVTFEEFVTSATR